MKAPNVVITQKDGYLWLTAPYNPEANFRYKGLGGKWQPASKLWRFNPMDTENVLALIDELFGCDLRVGESGIAIKGTEYLGKGSFRGKAKVSDVITAEAEGDRYKIHVGDGLVAKEKELSTFDNAKILADVLRSHLNELSEKEKEEIFRILFD